jgi:hypothetical protein
LWGLFGDVVSNEFNLELIRYRINNISLEADATVLARRSAFGLLSGNSNHCDYFVGLLVKSNSSVEDVRREYSNKTFLNPKTKELESVAILILYGDESLKRLTNN